MASILDAPMDMPEETVADVDAVQPKRVTRPVLSKNERAQVLAQRAEQLSHNAPPLINTNETDPLEIAKLELKHKKIPFVIRRRFMDGSYEDWRVDELA